MSVLHKQLPASAKNSYAKKNHFLFLSSVFFFWFAIYIYTPVFGLYLENIGFSYNSIGFILGSYGITQILFRFPLGILSDLLHGMRRYLLVLGFVMALISCALFLISESFYIILLARLLAGITASMWVMATILYSNYFSKEESSKAMSILQFLTVFSQFASMAICGYLVEYFGWEIPFWIGAVSALLGGILAWNIKEAAIERIAENKNVLSIIKMTWHIPQLKMMTFLSFIAHSLLFITIFGFSPMYAAKLGVKEGSLLWLTSAFFIPHAFATFSLVFIKVKQNYVSSILICCFTVASLFVFFIPYANNLFALSLLHAVIGLSLGFVFPLLLGQVVHHSPGELKMSAMGFHQSFYAIGILIGPMFAGYIAEYRGLADVFYFTALLSIIAAILLIAVKRKKIAAPKTVS
ncbi:MFS transporter [Niallia sp. NCCP-28]|uniref:MFS transporter n=1 Tax=Niallia sp. NCCP-28 TaxID=2934712 RepID=UPI0020852990|nr:MFS transporter [Niallia sp. NCCP-28]GKU82202.1 putative MFS-type transporter YxlH [Niallia sp. NCCP-28]